MSETIQFPITTGLADSFNYDNPLFFSRWDYSFGVVLLSCLRLEKKINSGRYFRKVLDYCTQMIGHDGTINTYNPCEFNIDRINTGKVLFELFGQTGDLRYKNALLVLRSQLKNHPRTQEGIFWHKMIYPHQVWLDGLYMGLPFLAEWGLRFDEPEVFDDIISQITCAAPHLCDTKTGLYYHAWDESGGMKWAQLHNNCSPHFWARAMGWFLMALLDVLEILPETHPGRKKIIPIFTAAVDAVASVQDAHSGLWFQVLDFAGREKNYLESSASCMFAYAIARAAKLNILSKEYRSIALKAWQGIVLNFIRRDGEGKLHLTNGCMVAGLGGLPYRSGSFDYYMSEPVIEDDEKAVGACILAGCELE
ncbi:MAG: glycoside hydrolase family 88 protein [Spirochaetales bacterium]|nr:glycoside hydrolase family 88 protein [Spirochaetales bacterium]